MTEELTEIKNFGGDINWAEVLDGNITELKKTEGINDVIPQLEKLGRKRVERIARVRRQTIIKNLICIMILCTKDNQF